MAVQAGEAASVVPVVRHRRRSQLGLVGTIVMVGAAAAALYLVMAPLLALLATAFRGPSDLLPFEAGAHWTLDNVLDVYLKTPLLSKVVPNTAIFVLGSVAVKIAVRHGRSVRSISQAKVNAVKNVTAI